ncbi:MAG: HDOD domain-containing protein [Myxococcales bacterium]|nr:HDOD domain-containing protein [Myxococcales bacterium]MCB9731618.1 HDOD domain-containing protein [Deltaproteobacteria bacterium]
MTIDAVENTVGVRLSLEAIKVPILPRVALQLMTMVDDENADATRLSALIHGDPGLAAHVMRISNSVAYGGRYPTTHLSQAVTRLGRKLLREVAVIAAVADSVFRVKGFRREAEQMWYRSLALAVWSRELAHLTETPTETAFLNGMILEIGRPVVLREAANACDDLGIKLDPALLSALIERYHQPVGVRIAETWRLPETVRACITYVDAPDEAGPDAQNVLLVATARLIVDAFRSEDEVHAEDVIYHPFFDLLGIDRQDARRLVMRHADIDEAVESLAI